MCGHDTSNKIRGGALAVLNPVSQSPASQQLRGDLSFHTPGNPICSSATHARWTHSQDRSMSSLDGMTVVVHNTGDLTKDLKDCGCFREFLFSQASAVDRDDGMEMMLESPVSLEVGGGGLIGRRISVFSGAAKKQLLAEGIVGFNF